MYIIYTFSKDIIVKVNFIPSGFRSVFPLTMSLISNDVRPKCAFAQIRQRET